MVRFLAVTLLLTLAACKGDNAKPDKAEAARIEAQHRKIADDAKAAADAAKKAASPPATAPDAGPTPDAE
jgi:hypothetical protein